MLSGSDMRLAEGLSRQWEEQDALGGASEVFSRGRVEASWSELSCVDAHGVVIASPGAEAHCLMGEEEAWSRRSRTLSASAELTWEPVLVTETVVEPETLT